MRFGRVLSASQVAASGLSAERKRMEVVANNIANAHSTRTPDGTPFRRHNVIFAAAADASDPMAPEGMRGVEVVGVTEDPSELPQVYNPGHPDADADGMVTMPNVSIPTEMVDMMTASRAYEANLSVLSSFREMAEQTLALLRAN